MNSIANMFKVKELRSRLFFCGLRFEFPPLTQKLQPFLFRKTSNRKWNGTFSRAQHTIKVCARSGEPAKSYSNFGTQRPEWRRVTVVGTPASLVPKVLFTPNRLNR